MRKLAIAATLSLPTSLGGVAYCPKHGGVLREGWRRAAAVRRVFAMLVGKMKPGRGRLTGKHVAGELDRQLAETSPVPRAMALILGASVFAYLIGVTVHEIGHYLANVILGVPEKGIVLHPFDLSYNIYGGDLSDAFSTPWRRAFAKAAGPGLNVALGAIAGVVMWRKRSPGWLPLLMWGPLALLVEGVGMVIGLVDYPDLRSDWVDVMLAGVPPVAIGGLVVVAFAAGSTWIMLLLPLAGIQPHDGFWRRLVIFLSGVPVFLLGAVVFLTAIGSSANAPPGMVMQNRRIALAASFVFVIALTALYRPAHSILDRISHTPPVQPGRRDAALAVFLGAAVFVFQLAAFN